MCRHWAELVYRRRVCFAVAAMAELTVRRRDSLIAA